MILKSVNIKRKKKFDLIMIVFFLSVHWGRCHRKRVETSFSRTLAELYWMIDAPMSRLWEVSLFISLDSNRIKVDTIASVFVSVIFLRILRKKCDERPNFSFHLSAIFYMIFG